MDTLETMLSEKIAVTAKEFISEKNINDCVFLNEPMFHQKILCFDWEPQFYAASVACEMIYKVAIGRDSLIEFNQLDRLFTPSPVATHHNFRGCRKFKTGNVPEIGALVFWRRGSSWQGHMAIVVAVHEDGTFDVVEGRNMYSPERGNYIEISLKTGKKMNLPYRQDKLNLIGFVYPLNRPIR